MKYATLAALLLTLFIAALAFDFAQRPLTAEERSLVWQAQQPPAPPHITRGPAPLVAPMPIYAEAAAVTIDTDLVTFAVAILTAMTLIFALLAKYLIGPMIREKLDTFAERIVSKDAFEEYKTRDQAEHERMEAAGLRMEGSIKDIWDRMK